MVYPVHSSQSSIDSQPLYRAGDGQDGRDLAISSAGAPGGGAMVRPMESHDHTDSRRQLIEAGRQFESFFISYLLKVMRETVPQGVLANRQGAYFHSFYDQEIGLRAAESGGIGIARMVQEHAEKYFSIASVQPSSSGR